MTTPIPLNVAAASPERRKNRFTVVIETPRGSRNKFNWEPELRGFVLGKELPGGSVFPYDFGFVPSTQAPDGDPLDVVVLLDAPTFAGCLVRVRIIGVIDAEQSTKDGRMIRNARLIGVARKSLHHSGMKALSDVPESVLADIEHFFTEYNKAAGKVFTVRGRLGRRKALEMVRAASRTFTRSSRPRTGTRSGRSRPTRRLPA